MVHVSDQIETSLTKPKEQKGRSYVRRVQNIWVGDHLREKMRFWTAVKFWKENEVLVADAIHICSCYRPIWKKIDWLHMEVLDSVSTASAVPPDRTLGLQIYNHSCLFLIVCVQRSVHGKDVYFETTFKAGCFWLVPSYLISEFSHCRNQFVSAVHVAVLIRSLSATAGVCSEGLKLKVLQAECDWEFCEVLFVLFSEVFLQSVSWIIVILFQIVSNCSILFISILFATWSCFKVPRMLMTLIACTWRGDLLRNAYRTTCLT